MTRARKGTGALGGLIRRASIDARCEDQDGQNAARDQGDWRVLHTQALVAKNINQLADASTLHALGYSCLIRYA